MKFLIVTCIKECEELVFGIFKTSNIRAYSSTEIVGFKDNQSPNLLEEWFSSGDEKFDSTMLFSFTNDENANIAMGHIIAYNQNSPTKFPIRAFIVPVEKASF
jgi:hypothetical protein